jgi:hypothetical protein
VRSADGTPGLLVADAGNHRVLRWDAHPDTDRPADAVLGQPDFAAGGEFPYVSQAGRLRFPYGLATVGTGVNGAPAGIVVADTANNRVLLYDGHDAVHDRLPDAVLGQPTLAANGENRWESVGPDTLCWPYGVHWHRDTVEGGRELVAVADSGNNRIVLWERP